MKKEKSVTNYEVITNYYSSYRLVKRTIR